MFYIAIHSFDGVNAHVKKGKILITKENKLYYNDEFVCGVNSFNGQWCCKKIEL